MSPVVPSWTPTRLPARSSGPSISVSSARTTMRCPALKYGSLKSTISSRSSVMVAADITASNSPDASATKMPSQRVFTNSNSKPASWAMASIRSTSKPVMFPSSSTYSNGGYSALVPMTTVPKPSSSAGGSVGSSVGTSVGSSGGASVGASVAGVPHAATRVTRIVNRVTRLNNLVLFLMVSSSHHLLLKAYGNPRTPADVHY